MTLQFLAQVFRVALSSRGHETTIDAAAAADWTQGTIAALEKSRIFTPGSLSSWISCPGCEKHCPREVQIVEEGHFIACNQPVDLGLVELDPAALNQWRCNLFDIVRFLENALGIRAKDADLSRGHIRFGTSKRLGRQVNLSLSDRTELIVGSSRIDLVDVLVLEGGGVTLDWELLAALGARSSPLMPGEGHYQPSTARREHRKYQTRQRNQLLQSEANRILAEQSRWTKKRVAVEIKKSGEFKDVSVARIVRVIRMRK